MKSVLLVPILLFAAFSLSAQREYFEDPLYGRKTFTEFSFALDLTRVNTQKTEFTTDQGSYSFHKNRFKPTFNAAYLFGWLFNEEYVAVVWHIKTGFQLNERKAGLHDGQMNELMLRSTYLQIPLQFGFRFPLFHHTMKNGYYRAVEVSAGVYAATPYAQDLINPNDIDHEDKMMFGNYVRFGGVGEVAFSSFNTEGQGHKFGIRAYNDFNGIWKIKETATELYPVYYTLSFFYNILNNYK